MHFLLIGQPRGVKWNISRIKNRLTHINLNLIIVKSLERENSMSHFHLNLILGAKSLFVNKAYKATRAISTLLNLAAIRIKNAVLKVNPWLTTFFNQQDLIGANA